MNRIYFFIVWILAYFICFSCINETNLRQTIRLDGEWAITKTAGELPVGSFTSVAPVPGLVDLATPALDTAGTRYPDGWYWHQRRFELSDTDFDKIELKINKAKYYTKVFINGHFAGENPYCFTPSYFDLKPFLLPAGQTNEIIIGVGCQSQLPDTIPEGNDFEKIKYIPGIYDHVEITLSNKPYIVNIQCVPDITHEKLRVIAEIETDIPGDLSNNTSSQGSTVSEGKKQKPPKIKLTYHVSEVSSGETVIAKKISPKTTVENGLVKADFEIDMKGATLWSPDTPFLYELALCTGADDKRVKFGMRSFRFDPDKKIALLNGKPYYMRGTNVCIFRFFEDPDRGTLPWEQQWPVTLHERFKDMNWHMMRYCIGFPPERWYEICDSMGFLLQDEYPYWTLGRNTKPTVKAPHLAEEYRRWMRERWNHPSVVIWDAQNESEVVETGLAINAVRSLDLSGRPWENGWGAPMAKTDVCESHPYLYQRYNYRDTEEPEQGYKKEFFGEIRRAGNDAQDHLSRADRSAGVKFDNPLLINEYGWIWLNRDGTTTTLTDRVYDKLFDGKNLTSQQRLEIYGRRLAELTEYWRAHRGAAGVLHFCGLAYSRSEDPRGQTSDHFTNIRHLTFEPSFYKYVKPAFAPVGLMIDTWEKVYTGGEKITVPVFVINDLEQPFNHEILLSMMLEGQVVATYKKEVNVKPYEVMTFPFEVVIPEKTGDYLMKGEYTMNGNNVFSLRDIPVR